MKKISMRLFMLTLLMFTAFLMVGCKDEEDPIIEPTMYEVTFDADNGTTNAVVEVEDGKTVTQPTDPTKTGYTFDEWQLGGETYVFSTPVTADITLIAVYTEDVIIVEPEEFTVSFNSVGGTAVTSQIVEEDDLAVEPDSPEKTSFVFEHW